MFTSGVVDILSMQLEDDKSDTGGYPPAETHPLFYLADLVKRTLVPPYADHGSCTLSRQISATHRFEISNRFLYFDSYRSGRSLAFDRLDTPMRLPLAPQDTQICLHNRITRLATHFGAAARSRG